MVDIGDPKKVAERAAEKVYKRTGIEAKAHFDVATGWHVITSDPRGLTSMPVTVDNEEYNVVVAAEL